MSQMTEELQMFFGNFFSSERVIEWLVVIPTFILAFVVVFSAHRLLRRSVCRKAEHRPWLKFVEAFLNTTHRPFFFAFSIYISLLVSPISSELKAVFNRAFIIALILQAGFWMNASLGYFFVGYLFERADKGRMTVLRAVSVVVKMILWIAVTLLLLDNVGVNINTLVAGLGIGGVAVALGVQKILGDIFGSLSIVLDRPFVIGDFIVVGDFKGTVEDIGIKTTRIRSLTGETIVFSNSDLLESRIKNYAQMYTRRVEFRIRITYETPSEKIRLASDIIKKSIESENKAKLLFANFNEMADFSLVIFVAYTVTDPAFEVHLQVHENILLKIFDEFSANGIEFAYSTQRQVFDRDVVRKFSDLPPLV